MWGAYFRMGTYSDVLVVIEMGAYIYGVYYLWVPFLLILRYVVCFGVHAKLICKNF